LGPKERDAYSSSEDDMGHMLLEKIQGKILGVIKTCEMPLEQLSKQKNPTKKVTKPKKESLLKAQGTSSNLLKESNTSKLEKPSP